MSLALVNLAELLDAAYLDSYSILKYVLNLRGPEGELLAFFA